MRTTLDLDEDVLRAVRSLAVSRKTTVGKILSDLARQAIRPSKIRPKTRNGVPLFPRKFGGKIVTMELINRLRDEDE